MDVAVAKLLARRVEGLNPSSYWVWFDDTGALSSGIITPKVGLNPSSYWVWFDV
jgi:hypothetical protein